MDPTGVLSPIRTILLPFSLAFNCRLVSRPLAFGWPRNSLIVGYSLPEVSGDPAEVTGEVDTLVGGSKSKRVESRSLEVILGW
jgi:hypothetical protein